MIEQTRDSECFDLIVELRTLMGAALDSIAGKSTEGEASYLIASTLLV